MAVLRTSLLTLMLVYTTYCSPSPVLARDQYDAREDWSQPPQLFNEATDQLFKMHKLHRFDLTLRKSNSKAEYQKNDIIPDLQVGCGEGFIVEPTAPNKKSKLTDHETLKQRRKRSLVEPERKKRNYYPVTHIIRTPASISYSVWRPQTYKIARPYYVPILGANGRVPIYFPAQPVLINPGYPADNPPALGYLPPATTTTPVSPTKPMKFPSRLGGADEDDRPIWEIFTRPAPSTTTSRPTPIRRTRRPGQTTTHPPLVHVPDSRDEVDDTFINTVEANEYIPPPVVQSELETIFRRPPTTVPSPPPPPPVPQQTQRPGRERQPMTCVFAIISCCSANSNEIDLNCFEQRGCPGPFWGSNPCDSKFANAALGSADTYFNA